MTSQRAGKAAVDADAEILKEVCSSNGLSYGRLSQEGMSCARLEMFFSGYPYMAGLEHFPNLQVLCIIGQQVCRIQGLAAVPKLRELWIAECDLQRLEGLEEAKQLRKLFLYSNGIQRMEHLSHLTELEVLWLNDNHIRNIEGLTGPKFIREINLAENRIEKIGNSLSSLQFLEKLELSGNQIYSFKDLTNLTRLSNLHELGLKSPNHPANPVGLLCNYSTHVLFHLPSLTRLDTYDVSNKSLRDLVETTVIKKKMFYNMKMKTLQRNLVELHHWLIDYKWQYLSSRHECMKALKLAQKEIEQEQKDLGDESDNTGSGGESEKESKKDTGMPSLRSKHRALKERYKKWEKKCSEIDFYYMESLDKMRINADDTISRLLLELESGGNIRFEDGKAGEQWFTSCHDLILSRFCAADFKEYGIIGIKIHRITRVHNRILRNRFDDAFGELVDDEDSYLPSTTNPQKKLLEYLFWVWDPELPGGQFETARVLEEGFMDATTYKQLGRDAAVPLSNSVSIADRKRILHSIKQAKGKEFQDPCPFRQGHLVIAKVYLGKSAQHGGNKKAIDQAYYPKVNTVYNPVKDSVEKTAGRTSGNNERSDSATNMTAQKCECTSRQCEWFAFNSNLALPEYIVQFEYITRTKPKSPFACQGEGLLERQGKAPLPLEDLPSDDDVLNMEPAIKPRPRLVVLSEDLLLKAAKVSSLTHIHTLNLHNNGLSKIRMIHALPVLKKLIVSFNELTRVDDLCNLNIEYLDVSFNKITSMEGLKSLNKLKYLDISWNHLVNSREDIFVLKKNCPALTSLDWRYNRWKNGLKPERQRVRTIGRLKTLTYLDGAPVTEIEATAGLRIAAGSRISQISLLAHSRTDAVRPRTLNLCSYAQVISQNSRNKPNRVGDQDNLWFSRVTTLSLDGQHICKLSNLERLENLRWASFRDNDLTKMEGLENCHNLEELSLDHNGLLHLDGLHRLTKLRRLNVAHNCLTTLDDISLSSLPCLHYLSAESNYITSLAGLQKTGGLVELYVANNQVENIREIFYLKNLPNLIIFDLYGNPVVSATDNYRLYVIYHLKTLKALDGTAIESSEGSEAKELLGGRLTQDFVAERFANMNFRDVRELDVPNSSIRTVDLGSSNFFHNLRSVNLEHNNMTSFSGLIHLNNLRVLCLNHNHVESIVAKPKNAAGSQGKTRVQGQPSGIAGNAPIDPYSPDSYTPILENLEVLHLGYNGIKDMAALQLSRLTSLKALFLQGNEITKVEGLERLQDLRELVLDRNKIKTVSDYSFMNQWNLQELHLEENRIRELSGFSCLEHLNRLFLGMNRIQEITELERLEALPNLMELSLVGNAIARRLLHRPLLVYRMSHLIVIDGIPVSDEERIKAEIYFMEQQQPQVAATIETTLPGINQYKTSIPVKVTNMQFLSGTYADRSYGGTLQFSEDVLQQELQRGGGRRRGGNKEGNGQTLSTMSSSPGKLSGTVSYQHAAGNPTAYQGSRSQNQLPGATPAQHQTNVPDYMNHTESLNRLNKSNRR